MTHCTVDAIWSKSLRHSDQAVELQYQSPAHTAASLSHRQGFAVNQELHNCILESIYQFKPDLPENEHENMH